MVPEVGVAKNGTPSTMWSTSVESFAPGPTRLGWYVESVRRVWSGLKTSRLRRGAVFCGLSVLSSVTPARGESICREGEKLRGSVCVMAGVPCPGEIKQARWWDFTPGGCLTASGGASEAGWRIARPFPGIIEADAPVVRKASRGQRVQRHSADQRVQGVVSAGIRLARVGKWALIETQAATGPRALSNPDDGSGASGVLGGVLLAFVLTVVLGVLCWILPMTLGARYVRKKGIYPLWMRLPLYVPAASWLAFAAIKWRAGRSRCPNRNKLFPTTYSSCPYCSAQENESFPEEEFGESLDEFGEPLTDLDEIYALPVPRRRRIRWNWISKVKALLVSLGDSSWDVLSFCLECAGRYTVHLLCWFFVAILWAVFESRIMLALWCCGLVFFLYIGIPVDFARGISERWGKRGCLVAVLTPVAVFVVPPLLLESGHETLCVVWCWLVAFPVLLGLFVGMPRRISQRWGMNGYLVAVTTTIAVVLISLALADMSRMSEERSSGEEVRPAVTPQRLSSTRYVDPNGFFSIIPPHGWRIQQYPTDPRGKVAFFQSKDVSLRLLAGGSGHRTFEEFVNWVNTERNRRLRMLNARVTSLEVITFDGVPGIRTELELRGFRALEIDLHLGNNSHNIQYFATKTEYEKYLSIATMSIRTYEPLYRTIPDEEVKTHIVAKKIRLAELLIRSGNYSQAMQFVREGLAVDPSDPRLLALKRRIEQRR